VLAALAKRGVEPRLVHTANSAGALGVPEARRGMVRVGLALLWVSLPEAWLASALEETGERLVPALTLRANVVAVRRVEPGSARVTGAAGNPERRHDRHRPLRLRRRLSPPLFDAGAKVLINGQRYPLAGMVTMDMW